ncbi:GATA binding protein 2, partial [Flagelloscypha sp. PMI_526]
RRCSDCGTNQTPEWRTNPRNGFPLCNACGIYLRTRGQHRPMNLLVGPPLLHTAPEGYLGLHCSYCRVMETPTWRRHPETRQLLCNACG